MAVAGRSRIANVVVDIGDAGPFDYYLSYWPPAGIIDPGYNAQIARFVWEMRFNSALMSEREASKTFAAEFDRLHEQLVPLWKSIERFNQDPQTIVVVPSMSIDAIDSGAVIQAYEERFLFLLLLLRQPRARLIYVTSRTILPSIIDYYLDLLPGVIPSHARQRLFLPSPMDGSARPLSEKLLERPRLI